MNLQNDMLLRRTETYDRVLVSTALNAVSSYNRVAESIYSDIVNLENIG
jgi:hypothetical protein